MPMTSKSTASAPRSASRSRPLLGTFVEIRLEGQAPRAVLDAGIAAGFAAVEDIGRLMSPRRADSDVARLNRLFHTWVTVHPHTRRVLRAANRLHRESRGWFDLHVDLRGRKARVPRNRPLDLGGIAKGYAVDCAVAAIQKRLRGLRVAGVVNAGGDLRVWGRASTPITVRLDDKNHYTSVFQVPPIALATSTIGATRSSRLTTAAHWNPRTGRRLRGTKTVMVFATQGMWADALTKVVLAAPAAHAARVLARHGAYGVVFGARVTNSGTSRLSLRRWPPLASAGGPSGAVL